MSSGALLVVTTHPFSAELGMGGRRLWPVGAGSGRWPTDSARLGRGLRGFVNRLELPLS